MCLYVCVRVYVCLYVYVYVYVCFCMCVYVFVCVCEVVLFVTTLGNFWEVGHAWESLGIFGYINKAYIRDH